jgi:hypothetical protein
MNVWSVYLEKDIDGVLLQTGRNWCVLMAVIFAFRMVKSFEMGVDFEMLSDFECERLASELEFVNVAIVINCGLFGDLKLCMDCLSFGRLVHSFQE